MFRIDDPSAVSSLPTPEAAGTEGYFTEGNPGVQEATLVRASWLNMVQEELRAIIVAAGLTPSKTTYNQLLTALRSVGVFSTPSQFDNSTKAATTAFVQRALGNIAAAPNLVTVNTALTEAQSGQQFITGAAGLTLTLPALANVADGAVFYFLALNAFTLTANGAEQIQFGVNGATSQSVKAGQSIAIIKRSNAWYALFEGFGAGSFASSLGQNGYKKYPDPNSPTGYFIEQWGRYVANPNSTTTVSLPIAFPNSFILVQPTVDDNIAAVGSSPIVTAIPADNATFSLRCYYTASTLAIAWRAIGY